MSDPGSVLPRLFCAVVWDDEGREPLRRLQHALRGIHAAAPLRWTRDADLHATLRFHGDAVPTHAARLCDELRDAVAGTRASRLRFEAIEAWPPTRPTRLVARFHAAPPLRALQALLETRARAAGATGETRPFVPHVTLARATASADWDGALARVKLAPFSLLTDRIALWHRDLSAAGAGYAELVRCTCQRPPPRP